MGGNSSHNEDDVSQNGHIPISRQHDTKVKFPQNFEIIMQNADEQLDWFSIQRLYEQLHEGVFLNNKRKKYWVDKAKNNCFIIYARDLSISWSSDSRYWRWLYEKDMRHDEFIEVAKLENVCWLDVKGRFDVSKLTPNVLYDVAFVIKMTEGGYGWEVPVNLRLTLPDGSKQVRKVYLMGKPKGEWVQISAGEFETSSKLHGEMEFTLYEHDDYVWKRGLMVKGVTIQPKYC